jgi:hypothetical protein
MASKKDQLWIDGVVGSQLRDTQGEMLSVEGADISDLQQGRGRWNDNHGKGFFNSIGRITEAKKIFGPDDCTNDRHKYYWEKIKAPYIYAKGYLYTDGDHMNAKAAAAILRNIHKSDTPLKLKASVEGGVVARGIKDPTLLQQTKIHSVALTFTPANNATLIEPVSLDKSNVDEQADMILMKSVMHLAEKDVPSFRVIQKAASAAKAARNIKQIQNMLKQLKQDDMEKGLKEKIAGAALAGTMAVSSPIGKDQPVPSPQKVEQQASVSHKDVVNSLKDKNPVLWSIAQVESSGGENLDHKTLDSGMHKGQTAGGAWGIMPKTAAYIFKLSKNLRDKYPDLVEHLSDVSKNHKEITKKLNEDPEASHDVAKALLNHIKSIHGDDLDKVIHSWHYGINGTNNAVKDKKDLSSDEYVKKISSHLNSLSGDRQPAGGLNKALTAGYGGADSPSSRTGGTIFQTESLEGGIKFKYATCDSCGDEQIYSKHQVKCRKCGTPWSLAKLVKLMG